MALLAHEGHASGEITQNTLVLDSARTSYELWPHVTILPDPSGNLTFERVRGVPQSFVVPQTATASLGFSSDVIWLRSTLQMSAAAPPNWILDIDYALLNQIDAFVISPTGNATHWALGNRLPYAARPMSGRTHALPITFSELGDHTLYLRVQSVGAKLLPIRVSTLGAFHARELREQVLQGLLVGLSLCLLVFSFMQWRYLQERVYMKYALLISASSLFSVHFFGLGAQYLWTDMTWLEQHMAGMTALLASCGTALFIEDALGADMRPRVRWFTRVLASCLAGAAVLHALDVIGIRTVGVIMNTAGLLPSLLGMSGAMAKLRRGDAVGAWFLVAWAGYFVASAIMVAMVRGNLGANFWTMHSFQIGATLDMLVFMRIAVLGTRRLRREMEDERARFVAQQKLELEQKVETRTEELARERSRSDQLLHHILPDVIAEELKRDGSSAPRRHEDVSVLFTDLVDFTKTVASIPANQTVSELNEIFSAFDAIVARCGLEKINTVGDSYMAAAGVPDACSDHAQRCVTAALDMQRWLRERNTHSPIQWQLRAGVHSGSVVSGVVGTTKFAYGIWGDTVNVASRMETGGAAGRVNISATTFALVQEAFRCEYRGKFGAKGKGDVDMYFVLGPVPHQS